MLDRPPKLSVLARRLLSAVRDIGKILQEQKEVITAAVTNTTKAANEEQGIPPLVRAEVELHRGVEVHKSQGDARDEKKYQFRSLLVSSLTVGVSFLTFVSLVAYAIISYCQLGQMRKATWAASNSADTAREALVNGQRAFVFDSFTQDQDNTYVTSAIKWENSGSTPTQNMIMHVSFSGLLSAPITDRFSFPDIWGKGEQHIPTRMAISAKGVVTAIEIKVPKQVIANRVVGKGLYFYVWGWARYRDVFPKTPEHVTVFCEEFNGSVMAPNSPTVL